MTEIEQILAALQIEAARQREDKIFRGPVSLLRSETVEAYGLNDYDDAFIVALEFWQEHKDASVHKYEGVEDYVVLKGNELSTRVLFSMPNVLGDADFVDKAPILTSYFDVGSAWIHDVAVAFRDKDQQRPLAISSGRWTGRYDVPEEQRPAIIEAIRRIRVQIEAAHLSNVDRANALALVQAAERLADAPDPAWEILVKVLSSPILGNFAALVAIVISLVKQ